ncbi:hypothetical protein RQN30_07780 [Arcanobacterium hippocoleae]
MEELGGNGTAAEAAREAEMANDLISSEFTEESPENSPRVVGTENDEHLDGRAPTGLMVLAVFHC